MEAILVPIVIMTGMFAMIFGIVYIRSRENMSLIEKGLNPRVKDTRPRPFINLKWGLLLIGSGMGLLLAYIIDTAILPHKQNSSATSITIGAHHAHKKLHDHVKAIVAPDTLHNAKDTALLAAAAKDATNDDGDDDDDHNVTEIHGNDSDNAAIYFALIAIGGGIGLVLSYSIEKKQWLDKNKDIQA